MNSNFQELLKEIKPSLPDCPHAKAKILEHELNELKKKFDYQAKLFKKVSASSNEKNKIEHLNTKLYERMQKQKEKIKDLISRYELVGKTLKEKLARSSKHNVELKSIIKRKNNHTHQRALLENFIKKRICTLYGKKAWLDILNHVDNPSGVPDVEAYKAKHDLA